MTEAEEFVVRSEGEDERDADTVAPEMFTGRDDIGTDDGEEEDSFM
jgi:hypothetical protein